MQTREHMSHAARAKKTPFLLLVVAAAIAAAGCYESRHVNPATDADGDADSDGDGDADAWEVVGEVWAPGPTRVDLLFVVDSSGSMSEEQSTLVSQMVVAMRELIAPDDPDALAVDDLHVGVISADMGTHGYVIQTCTAEQPGDFGELTTTGRGDWCESTYLAPDCGGGECRWLAHTPEFPDDGRVPGDLPIWDDFACIAALGTGGCGFEQPLEASYRALVENSRPGMVNEGFLRDDALLAVVYVTDEDDCSTPNPEMFNPSRDDLGPLNVRCVLAEDELYPVERYREAFVALKGGRAERVVVAAIAGVPIDGRWEPGDPLERLRDLREINPSNPNELVVSCDTGMGVAFPPARIVELVYGFGSSGYLASICRDDWTSALRGIARRIQAGLEVVCPAETPWEPAIGACRVVATFTDDAPCPRPADEAGPGRREGSQVDLGVVGGRRRCEILPADYDGSGRPDGALDGWYVQTVGAECPGGDLRFTDGAVPTRPSTIQLECLAHR
jgi:hypothetical protein